MEASEGLDDVRAHHGVSAEAPLVQNTEIQGRCVELFLREVLQREEGEGGRERKGEGGREGGLLGHTF